MSINIILIIGFVLVWSIILGFISATLVDTGSIGVVFRFRRFVRVLQPGLNFLIPFIESVEFYSTQIRQEELPAEADDIDRVNNIAEPGKKLPFRILMKGLGEAVFYVQDPTTQVWNQTPFRGLGKETQESLANDPLHEPITGEVAVVVEWYLMGRDDISISNFINNVAPEGGRSREEEVRKRIEDMAAKTLQELLGPTTLGHAQVMLPHFNLLIKEALESLVGEDGKGERPWGIHIANAYIKSFNPGITVNKARADAVAAGSKKRSDILAGEAQAERARLQAAAEAYSEIQKGMGEAGRISEMAKVMTDDNARFIATLDVAERVLPKASFIVIPSDLGVIGSILKLGQQESKK